MKLSIEIERKFYNARFDFSDEKIEDLEPRLTGSLRTVDETVRNASRI